MTVATLNRITTKTRPIYRNASRAKPWSEADDNFHELVNLAFAAGRSYVVWTISRLIRNSGDNMEGFVEK